jgi:hypothetical protein
MAISAQRFKFLDKETNVPIQDFTKLVDNYIYNIPNVTNVTDQIQGLLSNQTSGLLGNITSQLPNLSSVVGSSLSGSKDLMNSLTSSMTGLSGLMGSSNAINSLVGSVGGLSNLPGSISSLVGSVGGLPGSLGTIGSLFNSVSGLSLGNVILDSFTSSLFNSVPGLTSNALTGHIANKIQGPTNSRLTVLNNSICKSGSRNYSIDLDILSLLGLNFSSNFLSNHCSIVGANVSKTPSSVLNYIPLKGVTTNTNTVYSKFGSLLKDYLLSSQKQNTIANTTIFDPTQLDTTLSSGNYSAISNNLQTCGFSSTAQKDSYISAIDNYITTNSIDPLSQQGIDLYSLKSSVSSIGINLFSSKNTANMTYTDPASRFLTDNLGSFLRNAASTPIGNPNTYIGSDPLDKALYNDVFIPTITNAKNSTDLNSRTCAMGNYLDYDFSSVIPDITDPALKSYVTSIDVPSTSYKFYDLDSTSNSIAIDVPSDTYSKTQVSDTSVYTPYYLPNSTLEKLDPTGVFSDDLTASKAIYTCNKSDSDIGDYTDISAPAVSETKPSNDYMSFSSPTISAMFNSNDSLGDSDVGNISQQVSSVSFASEW